MNKHSPVSIDVDPIFILNDKNILITSNFINSILKKYNLNHSVISLTNYIVATTHTSYCVTSYTSLKNGCHKTKDVSLNKISNPNNAVSLQNDSYERLEFLGDSIIHTVLAEYIFNRFTDQQEGFMTKLRTRLENDETLAYFSQILGLDTYILLSRHMEETNCRNNNIHVLEDVFEAFIGALFLDINDKNKSHYNFDVCRSLIIQLIETEIDIPELLSNNTNYKDILLQYAHTKKMADPLYYAKHVTNSEKKLYVMCVSINGKVLGSAEAPAKKQAEQMSASIALKKLGVLKNDSDCSDDEFVIQENDL